MRTAKPLIRLGGCPVCSEFSLGAQSLCWFCHVAAHISGFENQTASTCGNPISRIYTEYNITSASSFTCNETSVNICDDRTQLVFNYTMCSDIMAYSGKFNHFLIYPSRAEPRIEWCNTCFGAYVTMICDLPIVFIGNSFELTVQKLSNWFTHQNFAQKQLWVLINNTESYNMYNILVNKYKCTWYIKILFRHAAS